MGTGLSGIEFCTGRGRGGGGDGLLVYLARRTGSPSEPGFHVTAFFLTGPFISKAIAELRPGLEGLQTGKATRKHTSGCREGNAGFLGRESEGQKDTVPIFLGGVTV